MPLPYTATKAIQVPDDAFNQDGLAVLLVHGGRYGGHWVVNALPGGDQQPEDTWGSIETDYDLNRADLTKDERYPNLALDSAFIWLNDEAQKRGWRLVHWENLNGKFPADQKPFFALAQALLANEHFVPIEGVTYADEVPR